MMSMGPVDRQPSGAAGGPHVSFPQTRYTPPRPEPGPLDALLSQRQTHQIGSFFVRGGVERAVQSLQFAQRVMIVTGHNAKPGIPVTDGPAGAVALADALTKLGKQVTFVTDGPSSPLVRHGYEIMNPSEEDVRFLRFDTPRTDATLNERADALIGRHAPDVVISVGVPSRNPFGVTVNEEGNNICGFNAGLDELVISANNRHGITTIGIGSTGAEAGMAGLQGVPVAANGVVKAAAVRADIPVTSWNANLGAMAIGSILLQLAGKGDQIVTPGQLHRILEMCFERGAIDSVTCGQKMGEERTQGRFTGVGGFASMVHQRDLRMMADVVRHQVEPRQFIIGLFDSSNGGMVAATAMRKHLGAEFAAVTRFLFALDHGQGRYGDKDCGQLEGLVTAALRTLERCRPDVIVMVCNTACTVLEAAAARLGIPVIDLIKVTARAILQSGGPRPALFATPTTVRDQIYTRSLSAMQAERGGTATAVQLQEIECEEWADMVNKLKHMSDDPAVLEEVRQKVKERVDQLDPETTSVWLCCTHYPALERFIREALDARGMASVPVVNPMAAQAAETTLRLREVSTEVQADRVRSLMPIVMTTGQFQDVEESAQALLEEDAAVLHVPQFGEEHDISLVWNALFKSPCADWPEGSDFSLVH